MWAWLNLLRPMQGQRQVQPFLPQPYLLATQVRVTWGWHGDCSLTVHSTLLLGECQARQTICSFAGGIWILLSLLGSGCWSSISALRSLLNKPFSLIPLWTWLYLAQLTEVQTQLLFLLIFSIASNPSLWLDRLILQPIICRDFRRRQVRVPNV